MVNTDNNGIKVIIINIDILRNQIDLEVSHTDHSLDSEQSNEVDSDDVNKTSIATPVDVT